MFTKKETALTQSGREPFAMFQHMASELDRMFDESNWPFFRRPLLPARWFGNESTWAPGLDAYVKDNLLVAKLDLPGMKKEDVKVEITDGYLAISGERKREEEENKEDLFRSEREYGCFYRSIPLPDGVKIEDVKASFANGVLEVSVPLPPKAEAKVHKIEIEEPTTPVRTAA